MLSGAVLGIQQSFGRQFMISGFRYCLPTDSARPLSAADEEFFKQYGTGKGERKKTRFKWHVICAHLVAVPVIAIFTKFDALVLDAFSTLRKIKGTSIKEAKENALKAAKSNLTANYVDPLLATKYGPKGHLHLQGGTSLN